METITLGCLSRREESDDSLNRVEEPPVSRECSKTIVLAQTRVGEDTNDYYSKIRAIDVE